MIFSPSILMKSIEGDLHIQKGTVVMKKFLSVILTFGMIFCCSACNSSDDKENPDTDNSSVTSTEISDSSSEESKLTTSSSSINAPLEIGSWGIAAKFCTKTGGYVNVPVRITKISDDSSAKETVKNFTKNSSAYTYTEPEKNIKWIVADYELSLDEFPVDKGGANSSITSFVTGKGGENLKNGDKLFSTITINITDGKYSYDGIVKGQIAYMIPKNTDYVITLGEYEETQTFFSEKTTADTSK